MWTHRDFAPHEIVLAPSTTEIKDRYWTQGKAVMVHLPVGVVEAVEAQKRIKL